MAFSAMTSTQRPLHVPASFVAKTCSLDQKNSSVLSAVNSLRNPPRQPSPVMGLLHPTPSTVEHAMTSTGDVTMLLNRAQVPRCYLLICPRQQPSKWHGTPRAPFYLAALAMAGVQARAPAAILAHSRCCLRALVFGREVFCLPWCCWLC